MKAFVLRQWKDRRLMTCSAILGVMFSALTVTGRELQQYGEFQGFSWLNLGLFVLLTAVYGAASALLFGLFNLQANGPVRTGKEPLFSRILGNGFLVALLLMACWTPVWLSFWPGSFSADSLTQFYTWWNEEPYAHHPLIHTALLGSTMMWGIDLHPEGEAGWGLAIYCGIQLVIMAAIVGYACWWLKRRKAPVWTRVLVTLLFAVCPFYAPWAFCAQKDVIFGGLVLLFCLQLIDVWRFGMKPLRVISFVIIAVLMMLFRNNGVYALAVLVPFVVWWCKGKRIRMTALVAGCMALYLIINNGWIYLVEAERGSKVEILSIPLQQIARTLQEDPEAIALDEDGVLDTLYGGGNPAEVYVPAIADPVKWSVDYDLLDENIPALLGLWARMGVSHLPAYIEAFMVQNLPYLTPYSDMLYTFDFGIKEIDFYPITEHCQFPELRNAYLQYEENGSFMNIPGTRLLSDAAFFTWLCLFGFAWAAYRGKRGYMLAFGFLLCIWLTCLLGPVALMRYMLGLYYAVPVLLAGMLAPGEAA